MLYHVFNKSICDFQIFNNDNEFWKMLETFRYYQFEKPALSLSSFLELKIKDIVMPDVYSKKHRALVDIVAYCVMPTHIHLIVDEIKENGISVFISNCLNSYTRYFNKRHNRKGPLWQGRTKKKAIQTDEELIHLTRYLHLNPVTAFLVDKPENWIYSSYREYISNSEISKPLCKYNEYLEIRPEPYREFVEDNIQYQRELSLLKKVAID